MSATAEHGIVRAPAGAHGASRGGAGHAGAFATTTLRYGLTIFPSVARELSHWRRRAGRFPDATLRRLALASLTKRGNMEGAALLAVLAPRARRDEAVRALVAVQAAYNYLDLLAEQPSEDPVRNGRELHSALLVTLDPSAPQRNYYANHAQREDRGYLAEMIATSRTTLAKLPSYPRVIDSALVAAARIVEFQSLNVGGRQGGCDELERWARERTPVGSGLRWWETAGACGSSLGVHVLIGLASRPELDRDEVAAVEHAYHPWIGALHSLLDSLVDVAEDRRDGLRNLIAYYPSTEQASERMELLGARAREQVRELPDSNCHETIVTAMASYYLSARAAREPQALAIARAVVAGSGSRLRRSLPPLRAARAASRIVRAQR